MCDVRGDGRATKGVETRVVTLRYRGTGMNVPPDDAEWLKPVELRAVTTSSTVVHPVPAPVTYQRVPTPYASLVTGNDSNAQRATVQLELMKGVDTFGYCSASLVGRQTLLTAAHCLAKDGTQNADWAWATIGADWDPVAEMTLRPFGICRVEPYDLHTTDPKATQALMDLPRRAAADDWAVLTVRSCGDSKTKQSTAARWIGDRVAPMDFAVTKTEQFEALRLGDELESFGYPGLFAKVGDGARVDGRRGYMVTNTPECQSILPTNILPGAIRACGFEENIAGWSGGPILARSGNRESSEPLQVGIMASAETGFIVFVLINSEVEFAIARSEASRPISRPSVSDLRLLLLGERDIRDVTKLGASAALPRDCYQSPTPWGWLSTCMVGDMPLFEYESVDGNTYSISYNDDITLRVNAWESRAVARDEVLRLSQLVRENPQVFTNSFFSKNMVGYIVNEYDTVGLGANPGDYPIRPTELEGHLHAQVGLFVVEVSCAGSRQKVGQIRDCLIDLAKRQMSLL